MEADQPSEHFNPSNESDNDDSLAELERVRTEISDQQADVFLKDLAKTILASENGNETKSLHAVAKEFHRKTITSYHGPIPPVEIVAGYENVCPGSADRLIAMAENQSKHRMKIEERCLEASIEAEADNREKDYKLARLGSIFAFLIALALIGFGSVCILLGKNVAGFVSIGIAIGAIGGVTYFNNKESKKKANQGKEDIQSSDKSIREIPSPEDEDEDE